MGKILLIFYLQVLQTFDLGIFFFLFFSPCKYLLEFLKLVSPGIHFGILYNFLDSILELFTNCLRIFILAEQEGTFLGFFLVLAPIRLWLARDHRLLCLPAREQINGHRGTGLLLKALKSALRKLAD